MNIILPSKNLETKNFKVSDGILYLRYGQSFQGVMYSLTYLMKGRHFCYYCKKSFPRDEITMDHMYPRSTGGPTIPQNIIPVCKHCNYEKSNMTLEQYKNYLSLKTESRKISYLSQIHALKEGFKSIGLFEIPVEWITPVKIDDIHTNIDFANITGSKYQKVKTYYETHHQFQNPIILDRNFYSLDGFYALFVAKSLGIPMIPAIILENVEIIRPKRN